VRARPAISPYAAPSASRWTALVRLSAGLLEPSCNVLPQVVDGYRALDPCPYGSPHSPPNLVEAQRRIETAGASGAAFELRAGPGISGALARYVTRTVRKIGLAAKLSARRVPGARLERIAPLVPQASTFLNRFLGAHDPVLRASVKRATAADERGDSAGSGWGAADARVVAQGLAVPIGVELRVTFVSDRLDAANCERVQPLLGLDLSSLCLK
jgi:hypothetical protein